jgi:hypothetical protein
MADSVAKYLAGKAKAQDMAVLTQKQSTDEELNATLEKDAAIMASGWSTAEEKKKAFEETARIQTERAARAASDTIASGDFATTAAVQNEEEKAGAAKKAAGESKDSWLDAMNTMVNALKGLGDQVGGVFGGIVNAFGSVANGVSGIASAIKLVNTEATGLSGVLNKIAGFAGGIGGIIGIGSQVVGWIGGLFHRDKDPGRFATNQLRYKQALEGDQQSLDDLYSSAGRKTLDGWATLDAREDAWGLYQAALAANPTLHASGTNTVNLRGYELGGSVPMTGLALLHRGETVVTAGATQMPGVSSLLAQLPS